MASTTVRINIESHMSGRYDSVTIGDYHPLYCTIREALALAEELRIKCEEVLRAEMRRQLDDELVGK